jgi:hypothetical protein
MTSSKNAFGVYTQNRDKEESDYGQGSQSFSDFILFWKDKYFVILTTQKATEESKEAIHSLASMIEKTIPEEGVIPALVHALPTEGLAPAGFLYFHHYVWLNAYHFRADYHIVIINDQTDALLAKYGSADERSYLLLVEYPDEADAETAGKQLQEKFAPEWTADAPIIQLEDKTWFSYRVKGKRLDAIFNGPTREEVENLYLSIYK